MTSLTQMLSILSKAPSADLLLSYWGSIRDGIEWQAKMEAELDGLKLSITATNPDPELAMAEVYEKFLRTTRGDVLKGLAPKLIESRPWPFGPQDRDLREESITISVPPRSSLSDDDIPF